VSLKKRRNSVFNEQASGVDPRNFYAVPATGKKIDGFRLYSFAYEV
jgi:hypothetical protein